MDHDFYWLFSRFWWLIFPLFWMGVMVMAHWSRHNRANRALDIVKSYADQGKDPPPDLMKNLQGDVGGWCGRGGWRYSPQRYLHRAILFGCLTLAFGAITFWHGDEAFEHHHGSGYLIATIVFAALTLSNALSLMFMSRVPPPYDRDGPPR